MFFSFPTPLPGLRCPESHIRTWRPLPRVSASLETLLTHTDTENHTDTDTYINIMIHIYIKTDIYIYISMYKFTDIPLLSHLRFCSWIFNPVSPHLFPGPNARMLFLLSISVQRCEKHLSSPSLMRVRESHRTNFRNLTTLDCARHPCAVLLMNVFSFCRR